MAHQAGINAVPAFVVDRRVLVLGAQPHEALEAAIEQAAAPPPPSERDRASGRLGGRALGGNRRPRLPEDRCPHMPVRRYVLLPALLVATAALGTAGCEVSVGDKTIDAGSVEDQIKKNIEDQGGR